MSWKIKFRLFQAYHYGIFFVALFIMSLITGKYIETFAMFISFFALRYTFDKTWHSKSFKICIFVSVLIFVIAITFVPSKNTSILSCVTFGLIIDYFAYKYKDYEDLNGKLIQPFNVNTCSQEELISRCREVGLSEENTELAIEFFIKRTKQSEIADRLCINEKSVQIRKKRLRQKLNKN